VLIQIYRHRNVYKNKLVNVFKEKDMREKGEKRAYRNNVRARIFNAGLLARSQFVSGR
jgi:hypothetical protein